MRFPWCPCSPPLLLLVGEGTACCVVSTPEGTKDPVTWTCRVWGVVPRAWGPHRTQHWDMTSARAASSLTGNVAQILLEKAWWVAWDPRGPIPILELGEFIPNGLQIHPISQPYPSVLSLNSGKRPLLIIVHNIGLVLLVLGFFKLGVLG